MFHAVRWTDMAKLIVAFHNFVNAPQKRLRVQFKRAIAAFLIKFVFAL